ncbi:ETX/MTX2 family pore-forming toxin [Bacillus cereus]|uniref:Uncharacterized protein n=1 Tax=Bacillus cereus TaxID=1396 RepID=A0A2B9DN75_BACCE|nr:ETX/MTX2 family pore-forming toxin [Bacillus cereus]PGM89985.1 hypothetical protein CN958_22835 [Bacillus cereus]
MTVVDFNQLITEYAQSLASSPGNQGVTFTGQYGYIEAGDPSGAPPFTVSNVVANPDTTTYNFSPGSSVFSSSQVVQNSSDVPITQNLALGQAVQDSNSTSTTNGLSTNYSITTKSTFTIKFGVTDGNSISEEIDATFGQTFNFSTTDSNTQTESQNWTETTSFTVPPSSQMTVLYTVLGGTYTINTTLTCELQGCIWCTLNYPGIGDVKEIVDIYFVIENAGLNGSYPPPGDTGTPFSISQPGEIAFFGGTGEFTGTQGIQSIVTATSSPLPGYPGQTTTSTTPLTSINSDGTVTPASSSIPIYS